MRLASGFLLVARTAFLRLALHVRAIALVLLAAIPVLFSQMAAHVGRLQPSQLTMVVLYVVFQTALPIAALVGGVAVLGDEIEGRTLTYLYSRPLPRPLFYLGRMAGHFAACALLLSVSLLLTLQPFVGPVGLTAGEVAGTVAILLLGLATYTGLFALLRLFFKRALFIGFIGAVIFEGWVSKMPVSGFAKVSVWHHLALLELDLLRRDGRPLPWPSSIGPTEVAADSVRTLMIVLLLGVIAGCWLVRSREVRLPAAVA